MSSFLLGFREALPHLHPAPPLFAPSCSSPAPLRAGSPSDPLSHSHLLLLLPQQLIFIVRFGSFYFLTLLDVRIQIYGGRGGNGPSGRGTSMGLGTSTQAGEFGTKSRHSEVIWKQI